MSTSTRHSDPAALVLLAAGAAVATLSRSLVFGSAEAAKQYVQNRRDPLRPIVKLFDRLVRTIGPRS
jgi:hypothetical protein